MKRTARMMRWAMGLAVLGLTIASFVARALPAQAATGTTTWTYPTAIATGLPHAARPTLAYTAEGMGHALWESNGEIYYASQPRDKPWGTARRIAYGMSPMLALDSNGRLHAMFANQFLGNYEIYEIRLTDAVWSLPVNVSHTSGLSAYPALTAGAGGALDAAWMDNSPGYWTIYIAHWNGQYWNSQPVPNARGQAPALATTSDGTVFLAWQDRVPTRENPSGVFDIFLSEQRGGGWSLPVNISDSPQAESIGASLTTTPDGLAHLAWIDGDQGVRYCYGRELYWPLPQTVVTVATLGRGPRIASDRGGLLHIAWDEGDIVRVTSSPPAPALWPKPAVVAALAGDLRDVTMAALPDGEVAVGWVQTLQPGAIGVYESERTNERHQTLWLPLLVRD